MGAGISKSSKSSLSATGTTGDTIISSSLFSAVDVGYYGADAPMLFERTEDSVTAVLSWFRSAFGRYHPKRKALSRYISRLGTG